MIDFWNFSEYGNKLIPVSNGIKISNKRGPIGNTWQSKKWVELIEYYGDSGRMARGRTYARKGQIIEIVIEQGKITSNVQGSYYNPYKIEINVPVFSEEVWSEAIKEMSKKAIFMAKMLVCEVPEEIGSVFNKVGVPLIPESMDEIYANCTCPDYGDPCKHIAATYYILAELIDANQLLFLFLRGCEQDELIEQLRIQRNLHSKENSCINKMHAKECLIQPSKETSYGCVTLEKCIDNFWGNEVQDMKQIEFSEDDFNSSIIGQFEDIELSIRGHKLDELLDKIYIVVNESIISKIMK